MKKLFTGVILLLTFFFVTAQNPVSRNLTTLNGLSSNTVYYILQDKKGFVWLGHDKGLSRYDGNAFIHFTAPGQQGKSLSNLLEIDNSIWCQDFSGNFYYTKNETLIKESLLKNKGAYLPAVVLQKNILCVLAYDSITSFPTLSKQRTSIPSSEATDQAVCNDDKYSYFFSGNAFCRFDSKKLEKIYTYKKSVSKLSFLIKTKNDFFAFNRNRYPFCYKVLEKEIKPLPILKSDILIQDIALIENEIWVSTTAGAYCFDINMNPLYGGHCFFAEHSITKIIKDRENNYWFGTLNKGVLIVADINTKLYRYASEGITALSTYRDKNEILAGTSSNFVFAFNSTTSSFKTIVSNEIKREIFDLKYDQATDKIISCSNIIAFYQNGIKVKEEQLAGKSLTSLDDRTYALAFSGGVTLLSKDNTPVSVPAWLKDDVSNTDNRTFLTQGPRGRFVLYEESTKTLYTATAEGLKYYNASESNFILLDNNPIYASTLCHINGDVYAGTYSDGFIKIHNKKATLLNKTTPILANTIYKSYPEENNIWLVSEDLVQRYNTITGEVWNFTGSDGLPKAEIKDILVQTGKVYLATTEGLVIFNTTKEATNTIKPVLELNKILVNDKEKLFTPKMELKPFENNIEIIFSLITFKDNAASNISYKINNEEWKPLAKGLHSLQLLSLAPGKYTIEIKATNEDGIVANQNIIIQFSIAAPFYKKAWFYLLLAVIVCGAIFLYFKQKLKNEKASNKLLEQKMSLEHDLHQSMLSSIKSQMNPHFLFNALNTVQSYIYTNDKENASLYLSKFSDLTRTILDMSNKDRVTVAEEIRALKLYIELEQLRFEDKLNHSFHIDTNISTETTYIPSMLIQPYIENAIKHGLMHQKKQWQLDISLKMEGNTIKVVIDDNGVGRKSSEAINQKRNKKHESFAASANQKRLEILNKGMHQNISLNIIDKTDEHGYATGTTVILQIPLLNAT